MPGVTEISSRIQLKAARAASEPALQLIQSGATMTCQLAGATFADSEMTNAPSFDGWDAAIESFGKATLFHSSLWANVLVESYGFKPMYYTARQDGKVVLAVPMMKIASPFTGGRLISLPFTDLCEPLCGQDTNLYPAVKLIASHARTEGCKYVELRGGKDFLKNEPEWTAYYGHELHLTGDEDNVFSGLSSSTRRNIKKAERENVKVRFASDLDSVKAFYLLHCRTRRGHGLPPQPFKFFAKIWEHVLRPGQGHVLLARYQERDIAGAVFLHFSKKALYKFGASDKRFQELRANNLIMWEAIKWYTRNSFTHFDLGRTDLPAEGLRRFKLGWGAEEYHIPYYRYDLRQDRFLASSGRGNPSSKLIRWMPLCLLRGVGSVVYKHFA